MSSLTHLSHSVARLSVPLSAGLLLGLTSFSVSADTLISNTYALDYELPKKVQDSCLEKDNCPDIDVRYIQTNQDWVDDIVNARVNNIAINSKPSEDAPSERSDKNSVKTAIDDFAQAQFVNMPEGSSWGYQLMVTPRYIGHIAPQSSPDLELFEIDSYVFTGGAHGMPYSEYLILDPSTKTKVTLDDMLISGKKPQFKAQAYKAYQTWVKSVDDDVKSYEKNWPFVLSDNITLTDKGVDIRYQHYAIGPYAYGMPVLSIPYASLKGVFKPKFILE